MSSSFHVASHNFAGPIELLLHLVRKRKLHINEVGLAVVADSFLEHFRNMPDMTLHHATHFLSVAATLVYVKSKALFPEIEIDDDSETALAQLVDRVRLFALVESQLPKLREQETRYVVHRPVVMEAEGYQADGRLSGYLMRQRIQRVVRQVEEVKRIAKKERTVRKITPRIALSHMMDAVREHLTQGSFSLRHLVDTVWGSAGEGYTKKDASISGFLAALEMVKQSDAVCVQTATFSEITITSS